MSEPASAPRDHAGVVFPPPLIYLVFFAAGLLLDRLAPRSSRRSLPLERHLAGKFGDEYHRYRARVRRWR